MDPETNRYKYPTSLREQYDYYGQGAAIDANFIVRPYDTNNGSMLQDSLNPFYNNSTNYFPIYYVKGKGDECKYSGLWRIGKNDLRNWVGIL